LTVNAKAIVKVTLQLDEREHEAALDNVKM
jgi:hypothetical protein